jgi:hypothetical protein
MLGRRGTSMGRMNSLLLVVIGFGLIAVGLWVTLAFEKVVLPDAPQVGYAIRRHPAAEADDKLVIAGALCLIGAAVNNRGIRTS